MQMFLSQTQTRTYFQHSTPNGQMFATILHCKCSGSLPLGIRAFDIRTSSNSLMCCRYERLWVGKSMIQGTIRGKRKVLVLGQFYDDLVWPLLLGTFPILSVALHRGTKSHTHVEVFQHQLYLPNTRMSSTYTQVYSK